MKMIFRNAQNTFAFDESLMRSVVPLMIFFIWYH